MCGNVEVVGACQVAYDKTGGAYYCTRRVGHDGPCAALPVRKQEDTEAREKHLSDIEFLNQNRRGSSGEKHRKYKERGII